MKEQIILILVGKGGTIIAGIISAIAAWVLASLVNHFPAILLYVDQETVAGFLWGLFMLAVNAATNKWLKEYVEPVQKALQKYYTQPITQDGILRGKTVKALGAVTHLQVERPIQTGRQLLSKFKLWMIALFATVALSSCTVGFDIGSEGRYGRAVIGYELPDSVWKHEDAPTGYSK